MIWRQRGHSSRGILVVTPATTGIDLVSAIESFIKSRRSYGDDLTADLRRVVRYDRTPSRFGAKDIVAAQKTLTALLNAPRRGVSGLGPVPTLTITVPAAIGR
jgi:hypothetical protein